MRMNPGAGVQDLPVHLTESIASFCSNFAGGVTAGSLAAGGLQEP
jgi:hypothetical protein